MAETKAEQESILMKASDVLKDWDKKVKELEVEVRNSAAQAKTKAEAELAKLQAKKTELEGQVADYRKRGEAAWASVSKDLTDLANNTGNALQRTWDNAKAALQGGAKA